MALIGEWCMPEANGNQLDSIVAHRRHVAAVSSAVFVQQAETDDATTNQESRFLKWKKTTISQLRQQQQAAMAQAICSTRASRMPQQQNIKSEATID